MKKVIVMMLALSGFFCVQAQEDEEGYTDEELTTYATVMVWAENEKGNMSELLVERIKADTTLASSYNNIKDAYGDEKKLTEAGATKSQIAAYEEVMSYEDSIKESFKETYVDKIKNEIGVSLYNSLKGDLKSDDSVKVRYEAIYTKLMEKSSEEDGIEEDSEKEGETEE